MDSLNSKTHLWIGVGALLSMAGVLLGAFGAHALESVLAEAGTRAVWETGVHYLQVHALGILFVALWSGWSKHSTTARHGPRIALLWLAGVVLFSGSLFGLSLGAPRWLGPITPLGGIAFAAGWCWLAVVAFAAALAAARGDIRTFKN